MKAFVLGMVLISTSGHAQVSDMESTRGQGLMLERVDKAVSAYASQIGIGRDYVWYCRYKMDLDTSQHPKDGSVPFGVDYHALKNASELQTVIQAREIFERSYLTLCLAQAKQTLEAARRP